MHNANDRIHTLEDELRNIGSKMSKLEDDHHKVIQELNVRISIEILQKNFKRRIRQMIIFLESWI